MKNFFLKGILLIAPFILSNCNHIDDFNVNGNGTNKIEEIVISANRGSGDITFINSKNDEIIETLKIEGSQPMYVVYVPKTDKIYVGDRNKSVIHIIDPSSKKVTGEIKVGNGVFHMWADNRGKTLWVNNDIDNTTSVIDLKTEKVIQTISIGAKPHDVFISANDNTAFVSILEGDETVADSIFSYSTKTYEKLNSIAVGDDPHLFYLNKLKKLYVPNQTGGIDVMDDNLNKMMNIPVDGSHGIFSTNDVDVFITDLPGAELYRINGKTDTVSGIPTTTTINIPHNVTVNKSNSKLYVTHSGATADKVTIYDITDNKIELTNTLTAGINPFGIVYYSRKK